MKTKIFILGALLLPFSSLFSQTLKVNKVEELKTYALSVCIQNNNKKIYTNLETKDITNSFIIIDLVDIPQDQRSQLNKFIDKKTNTFYEPIPYQGYGISDANLICYKCIDFYKSKELTKFIKNLLKQIK